MCVCVGGGKRLYIQLRSLLLLRENTFLRHGTFLSKGMTDASLAKAATLPTSIHLKITFQIFRFSQYQDDFYASLSNKFANVQRVDELELTQSCVVLSSLAIVGTHAKCLLEKAKIEARVAQRPSLTSISCKGIGMHLISVFSCVIFISDKFWIGNLHESLITHDKATQQPSTAW